MVVWNVLWPVLDPNVFYCIHTSIRFQPHNPSAVQLHYKPSSLLCRQGPWFKGHVFKLNLIRLDVSLYLCHTYNTYRSLCTQLRHEQFIQGNANRKVQTDTGFCCISIIYFVQYLPMFNMAMQFIHIWHRTSLDIDGAFMWILVSGTDCFLH